MYVSACVKVIYDKYYVLYVNHDQTFKTTVSYIHMYVHT